MFNRLEFYNKPKAWIQQASGDGQRKAKAEQRLVVYHALSAHPVLDYMPRPSALGFENLRAALYSRDLVPNKFTYKLGQRFTVFSLNLFIQNI